MIKHKEGMKIAFLAGSITFIDASLTMTVIFVGVSIMEIISNKKVEKRNYIKFFNVVSDNLKMLTIVTTLIIGVEIGYILIIIIGIYGFFKLSLSPEPKEAKVFVLEKSSDTVKD